MTWVRRAKPALFVVLLIPFLLNLWRLYSGAIIDPVEELTHASGEWAIRCLLLCLAVTPARIITGIGALVTLRRMTGLFAFFYAACHLTVYIWLDQYFAWDDIVEDVLERRYIFVGVAAFVLMLPLAATSFSRAIKALGSKRWQNLHRLVYVCGVCAVLHYLWLVKSDYTAPVVHGLVLAVLFGVRIFASLKRRSRRSAKS